MHFALIDNNRVEANPKQQGLCPCCLQPVIAKCGTQKMWHWAHRSNTACDNWWESETEWHRSWKNNFPDEWQEITLHDEQTGEKHIADVCTVHNLVIEFQHSHIEPNELTSRENFYKNMVWVVDGTRLKRDYQRFLKGEKHFKYIKPRVFHIDNPDECFPSAWLRSSVPVIFDFRGNLSIDDTNNVGNILYCLFPTRLGGHAVLAEITRSAFINTVINGKWISRTHNFMNEVRQVNQEWQDQQARLKRQQDYINFEKFSRAAVRYQRRGRRF